MEYVETKQFKEQPKEVQDVLDSWFKKYHNITHIKGAGTPLYNETELRRFIEEKLGGCNISYQAGELNIEYEVNKGIEDCDVAEYNIECDDMLEGYWIIACMIADEEVKEKQFWSND